MADKFAWFDEARFGMFIHWGAYSCGARYTWLKSHERLTTEEYNKYTDHFDPDLFDPQQWAKAAKAAGMKYFVLTSKHHDGFCLFDSQYTDYKYKKRDLLRGVVDAFRAEGLKVGIYYSLPDWHHPNYPHDARHPQRDIPKECDFMPYREYLHNQVRELLTNYGKVDLIWFDGSYPDTAHIWDMPGLRALAQKLQPEILISRLPGYDDFQTPEQNIPQQGMFNADGSPAHWEGCQVLHGEWCYIRDKHWKTVPELIQMLIRHTSRGGNLLLNVGPTSRGLLDKHTVELLEGLGEWMKWNSKAAATPTTKSATPSICTSFHGPTAVSICPDWDIKWNTPSSSATAARSDSPSTCRVMSTVPGILQKELCDWHCP